MPRNQGRAAAAVAQGREQRALGQLREMLSRQNWMVAASQPASVSPAPDLVVSRGAKKLAVELKSIAEGRADRLIPLWSQAWLQISRLAPKGHVPAAVVAADHISPKAADAVLSFAEEYAPEAHAGVMDLRGLARFRGPLLHGIEEDPRENVRPRLVGASPERNLFSDLNQWMLKVLLAPRLPERFLRAPRGRYQGPSELASAAGVSAMSASRLLRQLGKEGLLDDSSPHLRLVCVEELFDRWRAAALSQPVRERGWRALLRSRPESIVGQWLDAAGGCLALYSAARAHGIGFVEGLPHYVYANLSPPAPSDILRGFVPAEPGEQPDLIVRRPSAPLSVLRGAVAAGGRQASDILQVWLDVSTHPSRGREQAELIWRKVLEPICREE